MMSKLQLILCAALVVIVVAYGGLVDSAEKPKPLVTVQVGGVNCSAPLFRDIKVSPYRKKSDTEIMDAIIEQAKKYTEAIFSEANTFKMGRLTAGFFGVLINIKNKLSKLDPEPNMKPGYGLLMSKFLGQLMQTKSEEKISPEAARSRADTILDCARDLVAKSEAGLYLDWTQMKVNNESLIDYAPPVLKKIHDMGYGMVTKVLNYVAKLIGYISERHERARQGRA